jgi:dTDP-glucose 4,6-dehydratase
MRCAVSSNVEGKTFNVGSGSEISIGDLVKKIEVVLGRKIKVKKEQSRSRPADSEVDRLLADNTMAGNILKWKPKVTLDEGLLKTVDWIRTNLQEYKTDHYSI